MRRSAALVSGWHVRRRNLVGRALCGVLLLLGSASGASAAGVPAWLPHYDLDIHLDVDGHHVQVRERVTWINRHKCPAHELVFNVHSHYAIPDDQVGFLAKMAEILRITPSETMDFHGPPGHIEAVRLVAAPPQAGGSELRFHWKDDNNTALVVPLPRPVAQGEAVTVELAFTLRLPQKQGRWGQWQGVTFLSNWLPVLAFYDEQGWQPVPFIPWHQPWFNEAGVYHATVTLPCAQKIGCTGSVVQSVDLGNGWQQLEIMAPAARDFALLASQRYVEISEQVGPVKVKVLAFPEHHHYAQVMLKSVGHALPAYSEWFGPYPYPEFTIVESYFGWNGNECSGLVMIDERVFGLPHLAEGYVDYLVSHEVCHQWWYNAVGTNGYCETWMDESLATWFSHRLLTTKYGKNNNLLNYPRGLKWLPNIYRENYRHYGLYGTLGRGEYSPCVQEMTRFGHVVNLFSMCYDKGSKVIGMMEDRLGEAAFLDFLRMVYARYFFRILRVADFQRELEEYTGQSWEEFFQQWVYGKSISDWCVEKVKVERLEGESGQPRCKIPLLCCKSRAPYRVTVFLHQKGDCSDATVLGVCLKEDGVSYCLRLPVVPGADHLEIEDPPAVIDSLPGNRVRITMQLPREPKQIAVDPDQVLIDSNPANNYWRSWLHWRLTPLYTFLDETDLTNDYDKWNIIAGPWLYWPPTYNDPWFTRSLMLGLRADAYRTQFFNGGVFAAYRYDYRDTVIGADGHWDHCPWPRTQFGFLLERRLDAIFANSEEHAQRAAVYARYVFDYTSSLYLPPMQYLEIFGTVQDNFLPVPRQSIPGAERYDMLSMGGIHYQLNYLTPYWDPEGGFALDLTYGAGHAALPSRQTYQQVSGQLSMVKGLPEWLGPLSATRLAARVYGAAATPTRGEFFPLGGDERFRGYTIADRQGSLVWLGSLEWRVPVAKGLTWDCLDHILGVRNIYLAAFYDVGNAYINGHSISHVAHALGGGVRVDVAWFSFIDRTILRLDVAKTINDGSPLQVWVGIQHPF